MMIENRTQLGDVGHLQDVQPLLSSPGNDIVGHHGVPSVEKHFMNRQPSLVSLQIEHEGESFHSILHEVKKLFELSSALVISSLASFVVPMMTLSFVGHLGKYELSVVVLAASFFNVTGYASIVGSLGALETLISNAHGANAHGEMGVILQRSLLITMVMCCVVVLLWTQMESIMLLAGQEAVLAKQASWYLMMTAPSLFFLAISDAMKKYFTCQSLVIPPTVAAVTAALCTLGYNYVFITVLGMDLSGAALAANLAQLTPLVILTIWFVMREQRLAGMGSEERTWQGWSTDAFKGWIEYCRLAIPCAAMVGLEWGIFETCLLMSGWLDNPELHVAVMGLVLNLSGTLYMLPMGISSGCAVRVGNAVGAGLPCHAKRSAFVAVGSTMLCQVVLGTFVVLERRHVGLIFSRDTQVIQETGKLMPLVAWCMLGDGMNASVAGSLRGIGKQEVGALLNLVSYWGLGMPLAYVLAFKFDMGLQGLWVGLSTCAMINGVAMFLVLRKWIDWQACIENASHRLRHD
jgi:multidrug resistance protein, MATE family